MSHDFEVRSFYNSLGAAPGQMNIHTWHVGEASRDVEIAASKSRPDIGRVEWRDVRPGAADMGWKVT